ncbi:carbon-nitrogen hydrolase family protein [Halorussus gelatinilyticus]|uniref:Carbon-nitrogen hydrolase family protein n=1 Tax=Halorussus gelatinilyticus TaxID=2937524 RepID=A0A8U0IFW9_9EURY|nr:carbon-nitrogen hydrolase family protein [Halorussus gelatinilyticus]UPV99777.1 carbon-nitrogen hydrolase family protein [Halorussus gelatinilyticus]
MTDDSTFTEETPTVAACQIAVTDLDVAANLHAVCERVTDLPPEVDVALFPEYALTGFVGDERVRDAAIARDGPEFGRLADLAVATDTALLVGFAERAGGDADTGETYYNAVAYLDPRADGDAGTGAVETTVYRKRHLWGSEEELLEPGDERVTVETPVGTAGLLTCYDLNFVGESAAFAAPEIEALFVVGAWPAAHSQNWKLLLRARALDGVRWVVGAGRTGRKTVGDPTQYAANSRVVRPDGSVQAGLNCGERDLVADLDPAVLAECREFVPVLDG